MQGKQSSQLRTHIFQYKQETGSKLGVVQCSNSQSHPQVTDMLPPARPYLPNIPKQCHQLGTKVQISEPVMDSPMQTTRGQNQQKH